MKTRRKGPVLRSSLGVTIVMGVAALGFVPVGAWLLSRGYKAAAILFLLGGFVAIQGVLQSIFGAVIMRPDRLEFGLPPWRRSVRKETIVSVTWERGCGVFLRLKDATIVRVPDLGNAQSVCNSVRAWLKRDARDEPASDFPIPNHSYRR